MHIYCTWFLKLQLCRLQEFNRENEYQTKEFLTNPDIINLLKNGKLHTILWSQNNDPKRLKYFVKHFQELGRDQGWIQIITDLTEKDCKTINNMYKNGYFFPLKDWNEKKDTIISCYTKLHKKIRLQYPLVQYLIEEKPEWIDILESLPFSKFVEEEALHSSGFYIHTPMTNKEEFIRTIPFLKALINDEEGAKQLYEDIENGKSKITEA